MPPIIRAAGEKAFRRFLEFFAASIRNPNTRKAYIHAVGAFFAWCEERGLALEQSEPLVVASYIEKHPASAPTVKQHLAAIRCLFDWLVVGQVMAVNPTASVKGPKHVTRTGKTPVLKGERARTLFESIETGTAKGLRDRALIGVMVYSSRIVSPINSARLASESKPGRFTLYPTSNIFTFMLLDQEHGYTWQVQWGLKPEERLISPIEAWTEIAAQDAQREQAEKPAEKPVPPPSTASKPKVVAKPPLPPSKTTMGKFRRAGETAGRGFPSRGCGSWQYRKLIASA